jgi:hypothetical protein
MPSLELNFSSKNLDNTERRYLKGRGCGHYVEICTYISLCVYECVCVCMCVLGIFVVFVPASFSSGNMMTN